MDSKKNKQKTNALLLGGILSIVMGFGLELPFFILAGVGGLIWRRQILSKQKKALRAKAVNPKFELTDDLIIRLAKRLGGKISIEDLAAQTSLSIEQAKTRLETLQQKGICEIDLDGISESGKIFYQFD